jgi:hypothetical protein
MNVRIVATPTGQDSEVYLDGMRLSNVTKISVRIGGSGEGPTAVSLELADVSVIVDGDVDDVTKTAAKAEKAQA